MAGAKSGVSTIYPTEEPRALYTHCYAHSLNLACADTMKQRDAVDTTFELTKLVKKSPKRDARLQQLKAEAAIELPGIRVLCPNRWTVQSDTLLSVIKNYTVLLNLWTDSLTSVKNTEMRAHIICVSAQMETFDFFFRITLGELILRHIDNLSRPLQKSTISAAEGQCVADMTVRTLQTI